MIAAIEIYNKPVFGYRDECVAILLLNAWELLLKALLSKNGESVFYKKKRKEPYRTLSWREAYSKVEKHLPPSISPLAVKRNLDLLSTYRDNSVHFYYAKDFSVLLYALTQAAIKNFRDTLEDRFGVMLESQINWHLMPIGIRPPIDVASYLRESSSNKSTAAVRQFLTELARAAEEVKAAGQDSGRLLTVFKVTLESVKKIGDADAVVGVQKAGPDPGPLAIIRNQDPNITHPLRQREIVSKIGAHHGKPFTSHTFQAIAWKHRLKEERQYCWIAKGRGLTFYANDVVAYIQRLTQADLDAALTDYGAHLRSRSRKRALQP